MNTMLEKIQGRHASGNLIQAYLAALDKAILFGFVITTSCMVVLMVFPKHIFVDGVIYAPSLLAAVIGQICFVAAYWCLKNKNRNPIPEGSTFFTFLGLGFFVLAVMTCLLHSVVVDQFLTYHLELLHTR